MLRDEMFHYLYRAEPEDRLPVWVISYNRYDAPTLTRMADWECLDDVHVVVRESQVAEYRRVFPALRFEALPDAQINSCGAARWGAYDLAREYGHQRAVMLDDDLLQFRPLYQHHFVRGPNAGMPCSRVFDREDIAEFGGVARLEEATVTMMGKVANMVFDEEPKAVIGTAIKRLRSFDNRNQQTRYLLNGGSTPRQWTAWDLERLEEHDIRLDLDQFGVVGEDVGFLATLFQAGMDAFTMPSFAYEHWVESVNETKSLIRNADNRAILSEHEYTMLQQYEMGNHYLRVCPRGGDEYEWGEVDWRGLNRFRGPKMKRVFWDSDQDRVQEMEELL
jgi:hypothetical protein